MCPLSTFSELMEKVTALIDCDMVLKYRPFHEDLDALVSVRTDEDLKHMFNECVRYESRGTSMLRAFLFPSRPIVLDNQATIFEPHLLEQRYIDAINGIIRTSLISRLSPVRVFSTSSTCSTPKSNSPESHHESLSLNSSTKSIPIVHKVRSYPSIHSPNSQHSHSSGGLGSPNFQFFDYCYHHHNNQQQHPLHGSYLSVRQPQDPQVVVGIGRPPSCYSVGKGSPYYPPSRHNRGNGVYSKGGCHDEYAQYRIEGAHSLPRSPRHLILE